MPSSVHIDNRDCPFERVVMMEFQNGFRNSCFTTVTFSSVIFIYATLALSSLQESILDHYLPVLEREHIAPSLFDHITIFRIRAGERPLGHTPITTDKVRVL